MWVPESNRFFLTMLFWAMILGFIALGYYVSRGGVRPGVHGNAVPRSHSRRGRLGNTAADEKRASVIGR